MFFLVLVVHVEWGKILQEIPRKLIVLGPSKHRVLIDSLND